MQIEQNTRFDEIEKRLLEIEQKKSNSLEVCVPPNAGQTSASRAASGTGGSCHRDIYCVSPNPPDFMDNRCAVLVSRVPFEQGETPAHMWRHLAAFFMEVMGLPVKEVNQIKSKVIRIERPLSRHKERSEAPVKLVVSNMGTRDFIFTKIGRIPRGKNKANGTILPAYPASWSSLRKDLEKEAASIRNHKDSNGKQTLWAQVRYSDDSSCLCIYVRHAFHTEISYWMKLEEALTRFDQDTIPQSFRSGRRATVDESSSGASAGGDSRDIEIVNANPQVPTAK